MSILLNPTKQQIADIEPRIGSRLSEHYQLKKVSLLALTILSSVATTGAFLAAATIGIISVTVNIPAIIITAILGGIVIGGGGVLISGSLYSCYDSHKKSYQNPEVRKKAIETILSSDIPSIINDFGTDDVINYALLGDANPKAYALLKAENAEYTRSNGRYKKLEKINKQIDKLKSQKSEYKQIPCDCPRKNENRSYHIPQQYEKIGEDVYVTTAETYSDITGPTSRTQTVRHNRYKYTPGRMGYYTVKVAPHPFHRVKRSTEELNKTKQHLSQSINKRTKLLSEINLIKTAVLGNTTSQT